MRLSQIVAVQVCIPTTADFNNVCASFLDYYMESV